MTREERRTARREWLQKQTREIGVLAVILPLIVLATAAMGGSMSWSLLVYGVALLVSPGLGRVYFVPSILLLPLAVTLHPSMHLLGGLMVALVYVLGGFLLTKGKKPPEWLTSVAIFSFLAYAALEVSQIISWETSISRLVILIVSVTLAIFLYWKKPTWAWRRRILWLLATLIVITMTNWRAFSIQIGLSLPQGIAQGDWLDKTLTWLIAPLSPVFWQRVAKSFHFAYDGRVWLYALAALLTLLENQTTLLVQQRQDGLDNELRNRTSFMLLASTSLLCGLVGAPLPAFSMGALGATRMQSEEIEEEQEKRTRKNLALTLLLMGFLPILAAAGVAIVVTLQTLFALWLIACYLKIAQGTLSDVHQPLIQSGKKLFGRAESWPERKTWWLFLVITLPVLIALRLPIFYLGSDWLIRFPWPLAAIALGILGMAAYWLYKKIKRSE